jgi:predicted nuclease with TOPRIM domain
MKPDKPDTVDELAEEHADQMCNVHFVGTYIGNLESFKAGYEAAQDHVQERINAGIAGRALGTQSDLVALTVLLNDSNSQLTAAKEEIEKLKAQNSELEDKLYHESRRAPEVEYKLGHEIDRLQAELAQMESDLKLAHQDIAKLSDELAEKDGVLGFYGICDHDCTPFETPLNDWDGGRRAREVLAKYKENK